MPERENSYFIVLIPPKDVVDSTTAIKNDFAARFNSKRALRVVPHLTLKAPFNLPISGHSQLVSWFQSLSPAQSKFQMALNGFGSFENTHGPVVFILPILNDNLAVLQKEIIQNFRHLFPAHILPTDLKFKPHITVAYRDLSFQNYVEAWKEYSQKEFKATFTVDGVYLLRHDARQWNIIATYTLK